MSAVDSALLVDCKLKLNSLVYSRKLLTGVVKNDKMYYTAADPRDCLN